MDIYQLEKHVKNGMSTRDIAKKHKCSQSTVRYWLKKHGLRTSPKTKPALPYKCRCGETDPSKFYGRKKKVCAKCHNENVTKLGKEKRLEVIKMLGGQCVECKYNKYKCSLDVHHIDPNKKDPNFSSWRGWSMKKIEEEVISKCVLLCKNCHAALHADKFTLFM
jgi:hypothetical protein